MQRTHVVTRSAVGIGLAAMLALVTTGCTDGDAPEPARPASQSASSPGSPSPSAPAAPQLDPDGSADDNLQYFDTVNSTFLAANPMPGGRPIIDNLVAAGFDKSSMQVTPDATSIGSAVDSVQFSVRFGDRCLVGQTSSAAGYVGTAGPTVDGTSCLVGITRTIDW